jgi:hypothetical protein
VSGPQTPEDPASQAPLTEPGGDAEQAEQAVKQVIAWYNARLIAAQREPGRDPAQVAGWRQARDEAVDDLERLEEASADETVQIALTYAARLSRLNAS